VTAIRVHLDASAGTEAVGTAQITRARGVDVTDFDYDAGYLADAGWAVSPDLPVRTGRSVVEGLPGALDDSAPDAWGRNLITRRLASMARDAGQAAPTPTEVDFLLGVSDVTRQGALRFRLDDSAPFLAEGGEVPQLLELEPLLDAANQVVEDPSAEASVETLLAAGSGSLGGARPKASVREGTVLHLAKFPHADDAWDVIRWEAVALDLAADCRLRTPAHRLTEVADQPVLIIERFDRDGTNRVPFLSARSLVGGRPEANHDYLEIVEALMEHGSDVRADLVELWRRIAFSILINNVDDHLRNHAVLRASGGWTLSPLFDVNRA
jgi:serine/threonine-protein kinase HipA